MKVLNLLVLSTYFSVICSVSKALRKSELHTRIVGGHKTDISKVGGFLVAIRMNRSFVCGGSYVANRIVISAAHCVVDFMDSINLMTVQGGITELKEKGPQITVQRALVPENYDKIENDLDVSVILLRAPLQDAKVRMIKLCNHILNRGDLVSVFGWGMNRFNDSSPNEQIQSIEVPVVGKKECQRQFEEVCDITNSMLCAGVAYKMDACQFDSGGPLVHKGQLCGIVSFGVKCASEYPGVYADVKFLIEWIESAILKLISSM